MPPANLKTVHVEIHGRVQRVGFRAWTTDMARKMNLSGWVKNCDDGSVEAVFHGPADDVDDMLKFCLRGPAAAKVDTIKTEDLVSYDGPSGFSQTD